MDPEDALLAGEPLLSSVLAPLGFRFRVVRTGKGSGGTFAEAEFARNDRRLELHYRYGLGLVSYHIGNLSVSHGAYMDARGVRDRCQYPRFPEDPLDSFKHLAHDLQFADDFLTGSGVALINASRKEAAENAGLDPKLQAGYVGDIRMLEELRAKFKLGRYQEVMKLADSLKFPERMTESERKMLEIARSRAGRRS